MKKYLLITLFLTIVSGYFGYLIGKTHSNQDKSRFEKEIEKVISKPLEIYTIENLSTVEIDPGKLLILEEIKDEENYTSYKFSFTFKPNPEKKDLKTTTGQINIPHSNFLIFKGSELIRSSEPNNTTGFPIVLMLRGYVDQKLYKTGDGTRNTAKYFAENGFITIAPDFLGYGDSDEESGNIFESRFQTYVTTLSILKTLENAHLTPELVDGSSLLTQSLNNLTDLFIWGHSNGGQIALTVLEISGKNYPTTLWAPVSKPFPYSVLYYTDQSEDRGKLIRHELAKFEDLYDTDKYSLTEYLEKINASLQIHQGTSDDAVSVDWSNGLVEILENLEKDVTYYKYINTDHNMKPNWDIVVQRDLEFFTMTRP